MALLEIGERTVGDTPLLELRGELDLATVATLERALARVEAVDPPVLVLDLRSVSFIDSSGLRALLAADARARSSRRELALVRGQENVQRVFEIALLDRRLRFVASPEEPVEPLGSPAGDVSGG